MKRTLLAIAVVGAAMSGGAQASFLTLTGSGGFVFDSSLGFAESAAAITPGGASDPISHYGCAGGVCTSVSWGTPTGTGGPFNGESGAGINLGSVFDTPEENALFINPNTLGEAFVLGTLTHFNEPITGDPDPDPDTGLDNGFIGTIQVEYDFLVEKYNDGDTPGVDAPLGFEAFTEVFDLVFNETLNTLTGDDCPTEVINGDCADSFEFFGNDIIDFMIAGQKYTIEVIGFCGGTTLDTCDEPGIFISAEGETSTAFVLEVKQVPAPGALALISAGLIGLGFARRRQMKV